MQLSVADRLGELAQRIDEKDTAWQEELLSGLESMIATQRIGVANAAPVLFVRERLRAPGASPKMLLEHLALSLT